MAAFNYTCTKVKHNGTDNNEVDFAIDPTDPNVATVFPLGAPPSVQTLSITHVSDAVAANYTAGNTYQPLSL